MMKNLKNCFLICLLLFFLPGCLEWTSHPGPQGVPDPLIQPTLIGALVDTVTALTVANTASAPVNPYSAPIGIGLAGVIAMLEALRRKERSGRKFAENNNHVPNKTRITDVSKFTPN